jgi:Phage tail lysozyme
MVDTVDPNTLKGMDRPLYVKKVLMDLGWKDFQAAAMCGQFMQESYTDLRCSVWGDHHTAFGIAQWRGQRLADLEHFANNLDKPIGDLDTQARFVNWELTQGSEMPVGKALHKTTNIDEALLVAIAYERPRGYTKDHPENGDGFANRCKYAKFLM